MVDEARRRLGGHDSSPEIQSFAGDAEVRWRAAVKSLARRAGVLVDLGGGSPYQGYISPGSVGPDTRYLCLDIAQSARPNIVGDALELPLATASVDSVFCNAVLEHVADPARAVDEIYRVLRRRGEVMAAVPFIYPYHDRVDYYRFTDTALEHLFRNFDTVEVVPVGDYVYAALMFATGFHYGAANRLDRLLGGLRSGLRLGVAAVERRRGTGTGRDYSRALTRSPVGWHVYASKR